MMERTRTGPRFGISAAMVLVVLAAGLLVASPTGAIIGGTPDGNGHPYVGAVGPPAPRVASGVLISPDVVLTAAHVAARRLGPGEARVTFDAEAGSSSTWHTGTAHLNPAWDPQNASDPGDLAVVVLDTPVSGITPASLPPAGLLDNLGPHRLRQLDFELVGYGASRVLGGVNGGGQPHPDPTSGGTRTVAAETFRSLTPGLIRFVTHEGGAACAGDSGSPHLFEGTDVIAGVFFANDPFCKNTAQGIRVDTASARAFIGQYVALP